MLKRLRMKFVVIIMTLVGLVLVSVLGSSFVSTWQMQHDMAYEELDHALNSEAVELPRMMVGEPLSYDSSGDDRGPRMSMLVLSVDLNSEGVVLATNNAPVFMESDTLSNVFDLALTAEEDESWDYANHVVWRRLKREDGSWRLAIASTSGVDNGLRELAIRDLTIIELAMAALLLISVGLSTWVLKPVEQAWMQQRQFVADASHELKTPLAVIIANTQILSNDNSMPEEARRWVQSTADESRHMKGLVEELLELARTDESNAGTQGVMKRENVDFSTMVENASLEFDAIAFEKGTIITESIQAGLHVQGDPDWLERLCRILIDNACKYATVGTTVDVRLERDGKRARLLVNNKGNVIDPQDLPHLFDRFYRTDKARSRDSKATGFGLGLAIAKGIATSHGGDIHATSNEAEGTTFVVTLPLAS